VLRRLVAEANANLKDIFAADGTLKPVEEWPEIWLTGLVSGIEIAEIWARDKDGKRVQIGVTKKLKLADRIRRIELIGKHIDVQAFKERASVSTDDPLKKLFEQISGQAIRPRLEDEDADNSEAELSAIARQLNERPRRTLLYQTPAEKFAECVAAIS
jgi:phage terminase small subunit